MNPETVDKIQEALEPLAEKLGEGAAYSWEVLVRQMMLYGALFTVLGVIAAGLTVFLFVRHRRHYIKWNELAEKIANRDVDRFEIRDQKETHGILAVVFGLSSATALIFSAGFFSSGLLKLANPAYYAIRELAHIAGVN